MTSRKSIAVVLLMFICICFSVNTFAQCDLSDKSAVSITGVTTSDENCPQNGVITVNGVAGGGGDYVYEIYSGPIIRGIQSQNVFPALFPGNYKVRVTGCNGTFIEKDAIVGSTYLEPSVQTLNFLSDSSFKCNNQNSGMVRVSVALHLPTRELSDTQFYRLPLRYQVSTDGDPATGFANSPFHDFRFSLSASKNAGTIRIGINSFFKIDTITGLTAGTTYYVRVTDQCGVFKTTSITLPNTTSPVLTYDFQVKEPYILNPSSAEYPSVKPNCVQWGELTFFSDGNPVTAISSTNTFAPITAVLKRQDDGSVISTRQFKGGSLNKVSIYRLGGGSIDNNNLIFDSVPRVPVTLEMIDQCGNVTSINANTPSVKTPFKIQALSKCGSFSYMYINPVNASPSLPLTFKLYDGNNNLLVNKEININYQFLFINGSASDFGSNQTTYVPSFGNYSVVYTDQCGISDSLTFSFAPAGESPVPTYTFNPYSLLCTSSDGITRYNADVQQTNTSPVNSIQLISGPAGVNYPKMSKFISLLTDKLPSEYQYNSFRYFDSLVTGTYQLQINYGCSQVYDTTITIQATNTLNSSGTFSFTVAYDACKISGSTVNASFDLTNNYNLLIADPILVRITKAPLEFLKTISIAKNGSDPVLPYNLGLISGSGTNDNGIDTTALTVYPKYGFLSITNGAFSYPPGDYTFELYSKCSGVVSDTKSFTVTGGVYSRPNLGASSGYICDEGSIKVVASPIGGKRPFLYQIKLTSDPDESHYSTLQADSIFILPANTLPGAVYTLRTVDACNNSFVGQVVVNSFTGKLFIAASDDCLGSPSRILTGYIPGATYTWTKPDGTVIVTNSNELYIPVFSIADIGTYMVVANALDGCITRKASLSIGARCYIVLPIDILNFTAVKKNQQTVDLTWETGNETYNNNFEIERSDDGINWIKIGQMPAKTTGGSTRAMYAFRDNLSSATQKASVVYYRIKQVDANGKINYTTVKKVYFSSAFSLIKVYPTPFVAAVSIDFVAESTEKAVVSLFDMSGKEVSRSVMPVNKGVNHYQYAPVLSIEAGNYLLTLTQGNNRFTQKVTKIH